MYTVTWALCHSVRGRWKAVQGPATNRVFVIVGPIVYIVVADRFAHARIHILER
jgi:hypothetical protein